MLARQGVDVDCTLQYIKVVLGPVSLKRTKPYSYVPLTWSPVNANDLLHAIHILKTHVDVLRKAESMI